MQGRGEGEDAGSEEPRFLFDMGDEDQQRRAGPLPEQAGDPLPQGRIDAGEGFVEKEKIAFTASALAMAARRFIPPLRSSGRLCRASESPTCASVSAARPRLALSPPGKASATLSSAVIQGNRRSSWKTAAVFRPARPSIRPRCGCSRPESRRSQGGLAASGRPRQADHTPIREGQGDILQNREGAVSKVHMGKS